MVETGILTETDLAHAYAELLSIPVVNPHQYPTSPVLPEILRAAFIRQASIVPLSFEDGYLVLAIADGLAEWILPAISAAVQMPIKLKIGVPLQIEAAINYLYPQANVETHSAYQDWVRDNDRHILNVTPNAPPAVKLVNQIVLQAIDVQASDIHIEPNATRLMVRLRVDGMLQEQDPIPIELSPAITSRIKIMARLDISEHRLPQDGQFSLVSRGSSVHIRVSIVPSLYGEKIAMRILGRPLLYVDHDSLGLPKEVEAAWCRVLEEPNGLVLVTGPTGSGKTMTLYKALARMSKRSRNIMTIEEPIESPIDGICQLETKPQIGQTFPNILRSILRQDPDVIMVGEIRDPETASIAVQAATTGHLVLSTLHTNTAAGAITRLRDLGIPDYLLASVLRGVLAQRLVRHVCSNCKQLGPSNFVPTLRPYGGSRDGHARWTNSNWQIAGCHMCCGTGFKGRIAIAEFLPVTGKVERLIRERAAETDLQSAALEVGMKKLSDCATEVVRNGITTMDEVYRVLGPRFTNADGAVVRGSIHKSDRSEHNELEQVSSNSAQM